MMYPYQQDAKISANSNTQAIYQYNFPKEQNAIAGTFDPKANVSVGIIPQRGKPFVAYNIGGLLRFSLSWNFKRKTGEVTFYWAGEPCW